MFFFFFPAAKPQKSPPFCRFAAAFFNERTVKVRTVPAPARLNGQHRPPDFPTPPPNSSHVRTSHLRPAENKRKNAHNKPMNKDTRKRFFSTYSIIFFFFSCGEAAKSPLSFFAASRQHF